FVVRALRTGDRPRVPARSIVLAEKRPRRLVGEEHGLVEQLGAEAVVRRPEHTSERFDLVVESLRIDDETFAPHDADLALERKVVGILRYRDGDREREAVAPAPARDETRGIGAVTTHSLHRNRSAVGALARARRRPHRAGCTMRIRSRTT